MSQLGLLGHQMQMSAWVMLGLYAALALLLMPRELRFLREAEGSYRLRFIVLDVLLQVCVLLVLVPCALVPRLTLPLLRLIFGGFTGLWVVIALMSYLRYVYTYRILAKSTVQYDERTQELIRRGLELRAQRRGAPSSGSEEDHG
jgi:hypothetical protein